MTMETPTSFPINLGHVERPQTGASRPAPRAWSRSWPSRMFGGIESGDGGGDVGDFMGISWGFHGDFMGFHGNFTTKDGIFATKDGNLTTEGMEFMECKTCGFFFT